MRRKTWEVRRAWAADRAANRNYGKSRFVLGLFRLCQWLRAAPGPISRVGYLIAAGAYTLIAQWVLGIELPPPHPWAGLRLRHGVGLVVNPATRIGANVMLRHGVTLGNRIAARDCPTIGDDVEIGAGAVIIGAITIGDGAKIGPNCVVVHDVLPGAVVLSPLGKIRLVELN